MPPEMPSPFGIDRFMVFVALQNETFRQLFQCRHRRTASADAAPHKMLHNRSS
jgi:hypothetical protein